MEYVGSPPRHYPEHFQQSPGVHAVMPPMSPPQFSSGPMPGHYPQPQFLPCVPTSPVPVQVPTQPAQVAQVPLPLPIFADMGSGSYPLSNLIMSAEMSQPSISWMTDTQSPPLHPFPHPASAMIHFHSIQPPPLTQDPIQSAQSPPNPRPIPIKTVNQQNTLNVPRCPQLHIHASQSPSGSSTPISEPSSKTIESVSQQAKQLDYPEFAAIFRQQRIKFGYTHADVILQIYIRYEYLCSIDTIAQFEAVKLPPDSICYLKSVLQMWLIDTAKATGASEEDMKEMHIHDATSINPKRKRRKRTHINYAIKGQLEEEFQKKSHPSPIDFESMAYRIGLEEESVKIWFYNRRRKQSKLGKKFKIQTKWTPSLSPKATIPCPSYDIAAMIPSIDIGSPVHESYIASSRYDIAAMIPSIDIGSPVHESYIASSLRLVDI